MEEYLMQLYEKDGVAIFRTDYQLLVKLLDKYPNGSLRNDAYCIHALLGGNALYKSITEALRNKTHEVSRAEYNVFIAQMYSTDRFWKNDSSEPAHLENLLRMLYKISGIDVSGIPVTIISDDSEVNDKEALLSELNSAEDAYIYKNYRMALEKSKMLFENGVSSAASLLSKVYFYGNGTWKDYNKALFYLTYPHKKTVQQDIEERVMLESLLELRDKVMYSLMVCWAGTAITFLFMIVTGFFDKHLGFAIFNTVLLIAGSILFVMTCKRKHIFDFGYWFLVLGCIFLSVLIL